MKRWTFVRAAALALAALLAIPPAAALAAESKKSARGMTYSLRVPPGWDAGKGGLLVLALHGQGGSGDRFIGAVERADYLGDAILVAPTAAQGAAWEESDIPVVADLVKEVRAKYKSTRTIAFGFSRGGYMSFGLGLLQPETVDACIPHSGGLVVPVPATPGAKGQVFYVIHGDADGVVPVDQSREAVKTLEGAGLTKVKYEEVKGLAHTIDPAATKRAFEWVQATLGPIKPAMTDAQAAEKIAAVEKAVKAKDGAAAAEAFAGLAGVPRPSQPKVAKLCEKHVASADEAIGIAAAQAAGRLGDAGVPALKAGLKAKLDPVAVAAAAGLGEVGSDPATAALIAGLAAAESAKRAPLETACQEALQKITGKTFASAKEWKRWASAGRS